MYSFDFVITLGHVLDSVVCLDGLLPVLPIEHHKLLCGDGVAGDAVGHHPHPVLVGARGVETLHSAHATEPVPCDDLCYKPSFTVWRTYLAAPVWKV